MSYTCVCLLLLNPSHDSEVLLLVATESDQVLEANERDE